jgi:hypothetical protein
MDTKYIHHISTHSPFPCAHPHSRDYGNLDQRNGTLRQFSRKQHCTIKWIEVQRLSPENKGGLPYIPLHAGYRSKKQGLTHIWLYTSLLATSPTPAQCYMIFKFRFFKFYLSAMPFLPPCYSISPFDAWTHPGSKSII